MERETAIALSAVAGALIGAGIGVALKCCCEAINFGAELGVRQMMNGHSASNLRNLNTNSRCSFAVCAALGAATVGTVAALIAAYG